MKVRPDQDAGMMAAAIAVSTLPSSDNMFIQYVPAAEVQIYTHPLHLGVLTMKQMPVSWHGPGAGHNALPELAMEAESVNATGSCLVSL